MHGYLLLRLLRRPFPMAKFCLLLHLDGAGLGLYQLLALLCQVGVVYIARLSPCLVHTSIRSGRQRFADLGKLVHDTRFYCYCPFALQRAQPDLAGSVAHSVVAKRRHAALVVARVYQGLVGVRPEICSWWERPRKVLDRLFLAGASPNSQSPLLKQSRQALLASNSFLFWSSSFFLARSSSTFLRACSFLRLMAPSSTGFTFLTFLWGL